MSKGNYYDISVERRKMKRKIKGTISFLAIILIIALIVALIIKTQENRELKQQVRDLTVMVTAERPDIPEPARGNVKRIQSLGTFHIYHYCPCARCCGTANEITASGSRAREGETIAVDPAVIPLGTEVIIDGHKYIAEDTGSGITGNKIDIYVSTHEEALRLGIKTSEVFIKK